MPAAWEPSTISSVHYREKQRRRKRRKTCLNQPSKIHPNAKLDNSGFCCWSSAFAHSTGHSQLAPHHSASIQIQNSCVRRCLRATPSSCIARVSTFTMHKHIPVGQALVDPFRRGTASFRDQQQELDEDCQATVASNVQLSGRWCKASIKKTWIKIVSWYRRVLPPLLMQLYACFMPSKALEWFVCRRSSCLLHCNRPSGERWQHMFNASPRLTSCKCWLQLDGGRVGRPRRRVSNWMEMHCWGDLRLQLCS